MNGTGQAGRADGAGRETLIFFHIPKTAGMTLTRIMRRQYPKDTIYKIEDDLAAADRRFRAMDEEDRRQYRLIAGHLALGIHEAVPGPSTYVTMLRDPVERVLSTYDFIRREERHWAYDEIVEQDLSLDDVLRSGIVPMMENGQTRILSGRGDPAVLPYGETTRDLLPAARENLAEHFSVVGITELFDQSLLLMKERYGWGPVFYEKRNVTRDRLQVDDLDPSTLELIHELNELDRELYREARSSLERRIDDEGAGFRLKLSGFRAANRARTRVKQSLRRLRS